MRNIFWAGDSTVKENKYETFPQTGIGQEFHRFLKREIHVYNFAENGRSTKSFIDEQRLAQIYDLLDDGDFFFIQFGHNDEKIEDPNRYTDPASDFQENLKKYINVARNKKALPVLITPVERREFLDNGELKKSAHDAYSDAIKKVGKEEGLPVIDLHKKSRELIQTFGREKSIDLFMHVEKGIYTNFPEGKTDNTHLRPEGAARFGALIAEEIKKLGTPYSEILV